MKRSASDLLDSASSSDSEPTATPAAATSAISSPDMSAAAAAAAIAPAAAAAAAAAVAAPAAAAAVTDTHVMVNGINIQIVTTRPALPQNVNYSHRRKNDEEWKSKQWKVNELTSAEVLHAYRLLLQSDCVVDKSRAPDDEPRWCYLSYKSLNNDGYARVRKKALHYAHHIGVRVGLDGSGTYKIAETTQWAISHLCHTRNCFRPSHVIVETTYKNLDRKGCKAASCTHAPACLFDATRAYDE